MGLACFMIHFHETSATFLLFAAKGLREGGQRLANCFSRCPNFGPEKEFKHFSDPLGAYHLM